MTQRWCDSCDTEDEPLFPYTAKFVLWDDEFVTVPKGKRSTIKRYELPEDEWTADVREARWQSEGLYCAFCLVKTIAEDRLASAMVAIDKLQAVNDLMNRAAEKEQEAGGCVEPAEWDYTTQEKALAMERVLRKYGAVLVPKSEAA